MTIFPQFRKFVPPVPVKSPPLEAPGASAEAPGASDCPTLETIATPGPAPAPAPAVTQRIAPTLPTRPESSPGSKPTPAGPAAVPVHEVGRDWLQAFAPVCDRCLSSVYLERRYSDGSEAMTCVCCGAVVDGEPKPGLTAERRAKREAERAKLSGRFAEDGNN